jgi:hypothetical protein
MFKTDTVFVIGAGASAELNFPVGDELRNKIVSAVDIHLDSLGQVQRGDGELLEQVTAAAGTKRSEVIRAGRRIVSGIHGRASIDEFLDYHADDKLMVALGKAAIVKQILSEEARALHQFFGDEQNFALSSFEEKWYGRLFRLLNKGYRAGQEGKFFDNTSFVIFNYDRNWEFFLSLAIQNFCGVRAERAREVCSTGSTFYRPYGKVGPIFQNNGIAYGANGQNFSAPSLSANIRTFTEQEQLAIDVKAIQDRICEAKTIVFLGFSYNEMNVRLLAPRSQSGKKRIFGTAYGLPGPELDDRQKDLPAWLNCNPGSTVALDSTKCVDFLKKFGDRIAQST